MKTLQTALLFPLLAWTSTAPAASQSAERRVGAMGTELSIVVLAPAREAALEAGERAIEAIRAAESRLSTWDPRSEASRLNATPAGDPADVSPLLARDLAAAQRCSDETDGAFTPGMGALVEAWGLRHGGRLPTDEEIARALPAVASSNLLVAGGRATRLHGTFKLEEGGFGKGAGLDDALAALERSAADSAVLDLGGQVAVWGGRSLTVDVADPRRRDRVVLHLEIDRGSVATTGNSERGIVVGELRLGHVLDPATGRPSRDFGSVTVWTDRAARADCLSTALYVMGPDRALEWAARHPDVAAIVIEAGEHGLRARASANLRDRVRAAVGDLELRFPEAGTASNPTGKSTTGSPRRGTRGDDGDEG